MQGLLQVEGLGSSPSSTQRFFIKFICFTSTCIDFSFTEPFFLNRNLSLSTDIYTTVRQFPESNYDNETDGVGIGFGYANGEYGRQSINYSLAERNIIAYSGASSSIVSESGKNILSLFTLGNVIDKSNSRIDPTEGWFFSNSLGLAGIGGDKKYIKISLAPSRKSKSMRERISLLCSFFF